MLAIERTVEVWSSLLPRLPSLPSSEVSELVTYVDLAVDGKCNFQIPSKKQRAPGKVNFDLTNLSFVADNIVATKDLDILLPLLCDRVNSLNSATEQLRQGFASSSSVVPTDVSKLHLDLILLRDNLGSDPGLTTLPLRSAWEGITFTKHALAELP